MTRPQISGPVRFRYCTWGEPMIASFRNPASIKSPASPRSQAVFSGPRTLCFKHNRRPPHRRSLSSSAASPCSASSRRAVRALARACTHARAHTQGRPAGRPASQPPGRPPTKRRRIQIMENMRMHCNVSLCSLHAVATSEKVSPPRTWHDHFQTIKCVN